MPESRTEGWGRDGGFSFFLFTFLISIFRWFGTGVVVSSKGARAGSFCPFFFRLAYPVIRIDYS